VQMLFLSKIKIMLMYNSNNSK